MGVIITGTGAERLRLATQVADAVAGVDQADIDRPIGVVVDELHVTLPPDVPRDWSVRRAIERAVQEARHGAQEVLDEVAHADGWPR